MEPNPYRAPESSPAGYLRPVTDPLRSFLYVAGGWACLGLAVIGAVLPLLPTFTDAATTIRGVSCSFSWDGGSTSVNVASFTVTHGTGLTLRHGDLVRIGPYRLRLVSLGATGTIVVPLEGEGADNAEAVAPLSEGATSHSMAQ